MRTAPAGAGRPLPATLPTSTYKYTPKKREVWVMYPSGVTTIFTIEYALIDWFDYARLVWPYRREGTLEIIEIPEAHCTFHYGKPKFNQCVYTASSDYIQARWGRRLDTSDCDWLAEHPLATDDGVPHGYTATCVHELVLPYGMGVDRMRLRKDTSVLGDHMLGWMTSLGCNPFGMVDRSTTNAQAAERLQMPLAEADALWRFEFHDTALPGSIIGEKGWGGSVGKGVSVGNFGGHSRYLAPRAQAGDWTISVQLAPTSDYLVDPPSDPYVARKGNPTLLVTDVTDPDGKAIAEKSGTKWIPVSPRVRSIVHWKEPEVTTIATGLPASNPAPFSTPTKRMIYPCTRCNVVNSCSYDALLCDKCDTVTKPIPFMAPELTVEQATIVEEWKQEAASTGASVPSITPSTELTHCAYCGCFADASGVLNDDTFEFVCASCIGAAFTGLVCPGCAIRLSQFPPDPLGFVPPVKGSIVLGYAEWRCTECREDFRTDEPARSAKGLQPYDLAEEMWDSIDGWDGDPDTQDVLDQLDHDQEDLLLLPDPADG